MNIGRNTRLIPAIGLVAMVAAKAALAQNAPPLSETDEQFVRGAFGTCVHGHTSNHQNAGVDLMFISKYCICAAMASKPANTADENAMAAFAAEVQTPAGKAKLLAQAKVCEDRVTKEYQDAANKTP